MQFGRESLNDARRTPGKPLASGALDPMGWICSKEPDHFSKGD